MINADDGKLTTLKSGTTIVGLRTNDFVIIASDQQSTMGYMASGFNTQKVFPVTSNIVLGLAGTLGDAVQMIRVLKMQAALYENERNKKMDTRALVTLAANIFNSNRYYPYEAYFVVGGFVDKPELYSIDPVGGIGKEKNITATGSGMMFATSILDSKYKEKMSKEDAINLVCEAINASKKRDIATGGENIDIYFIDKKGIENIKKE